MQSGELAGIAVGATVILNVLLAGYVSSPSHNDHEFFFTATERCT